MNLADLCYAALTAVEPQKSNRLVPCSSTDSKDAQSCDEISTETRFISNRRFDVYFGRSHPGTSNPNPSLLLLIECTALASQPGPLEIIGIPQRSMD